jgi:hypothetical protein
VIFFKKDICIPITDRELEVDPRASGLGGIHAIGDGKHELLGSFMCLSQSCKIRGLVCIQFNSQPLQKLAFLEITVFLKKANQVVLTACVLMYYDVHRADRFRAFNLVFGVDLIMGLDNWD